MKKFCFIACVNNDILMNECRLYIERLYIPEGWSVEVITIKEAPSMAEGYNTAMNASDADIKIYLHQDVFIINRYFLVNIVKIFNSDPNIGIIGMAGVCRLPDCGVMWRGGDYRGKIYQSLEENYQEEKLNGKISVDKVVCVDGLCIVTSKNVFWREDLFKGFDFYDVSESFEYRRKGYDVVVPEQSYAWCIHDDGRILSLFNYNKSRKIFIKEYGNMPFDMNGNTRQDTDDTDDYVEMLSDYEKRKEYYLGNQKKFINKAESYIRNKDIDGLVSMENEIADGLKSKELKLSQDIILIKMLAQALYIEKKINIGTFIDGLSTFSEVKEKWLKISLYLKRIEFNFQEELQHEGIKYIHDNKVSPYSIAAIIYGTLSYIGHREKLMLRIAESYLDKGDVYTSYHFLKSIIEPGEETQALIKELESVIL